MASMLLPGGPQRLGEPLAGAMAESAVDLNPASLPSWLSLALSLVIRPEGSYQAWTGVRASGPALQHLLRCYQP
jgi:hypothetical protein